VPNGAVYSVTFAEWEYVARTASGSPLGAGTTATASVWPGRLIKSCLLRELLRIVDGVFSLDTWSPMMIHILTAERLRWRLTAINLHQSAKMVSYYIERHILGRIKKFSESIVIPST